MRITVDTNVLISGTFWKGAPFRVLQVIDEGKVSCVLSLDILDEYARVLQRDEIAEKRLLPDIGGVVSRVLQKSSLVRPHFRLNVVSDEPDNRVLECAVAGKCNFLVTQDNHLLRLKEWRGIRILTPGAFLETKPF